VKIEAAIEARRAPSMSVAVARDGGIVWSDGFGLADNARRTPATASTPYAVASLTKTFTATALMVLHERNRLALDDPIAKHLGAVARPNVAAPPEVTIRRTLENVAGFPVHAQWFFLDRPARPSSFAETLRCYGTEISRPGPRYVYSNLGYGVLGELIARASGQTYEIFLARNVLQPLGLASAKIARRVEETAGAATLYGTDGEAIPFFLSDHPGASDLYISAEDLARFGLFHAGGLQPSRPVIGEASRKAMQQPGLGGYGFGWLINADWRDRRVVFNSGAKPGASAALWILPAPTELRSRSSRTKSVRPSTSWRARSSGACSASNNQRLLHPLHPHPPDRVLRSRGCRRRVPSFEVSGADRSVHVLARSISRSTFATRTISSPSSAARRPRSLTQEPLRAGKRPAR